LNDLVKSRTELECTIADLRVASDRAGGSLDELKEELINIEGQIGDKEIELNDLVPQWDDFRARASELKRTLDEKRGHLDVLYAKQGRIQRFRTKGERDNFLTKEIASLEAHRTTQIQALEKAKADLESATTRLQEVEEKRDTAQARAEQSRAEIAELSAKVATEKDSQEEMKERRKGLWREDTKLDSVLSRASEELRTAERALASMMDKVSGHTSMCVARSHTDRSSGHWVWSSCNRFNRGKARL
jgi:structural maintenance of chromosome 3 (chondroitin sulfate proteoglycan 6)